MQYFHQYLSLCQSVQTAPVLRVTRIPFHPNGDHKNDDRSAIEHDYLLAGGKNGQFRFRVDRRGAVSVKP